MEHTPPSMSSLLKCCIELFEANGTLKDRVQYLEYLLPDLRSLKINRLIVLDGRSVF